MPSTMIPIIDCSPIADGAFEDVSEEDFTKVASDIGAAMTGIGMYYLINHGIDKDKIEKIQKMSKSFFELPMETKRKYRKVAPTQSFHGYGGPDDEMLNEQEKKSSELKEFFDISGFEAQDEKYYPKEVPGFKTVFDEVRGELENYGKKLLRCLEKYLKLEDGFLLSRHTNLGNPTVKTHTAFRSLYYSTLDTGANFPPNAIRCGEHSDWGTITLLIQDMVGGLEVKTSKGEWIEAAPIDNAILVNGGQLLEYWTGGYYHAALHRVRNLAKSRIAQEPRQSFIYSINPDGDAKVYPVIPVLPKMEEHFAKYNNETIIAYDHFQSLIANATF